jgi:mannose-6-phosphate isomerase-like protein (cupin superfamily)
MPGKKILTNKNKSMDLVYKVSQVKSIQAPNFIMHPAELKDFIDFEVKRVYYITNTTGATGAHCHLQEDELFILLQGTCTAVIDAGKGMQEITMKQNDAHVVGNFVWHHFKDFSEDALLLALSSTNYNPDRSDYIEDYEQYLQVRQEKFGV